MTTDLERIGRDTAVLAAVVGEQRHAAIACYPGWAVADLVRHVGAIHRWVTDIVTSRATARPDAPAAVDGAVEDLPTWLQEGAARLVEVLRDVDPDVEVWTISRTDRTCGFWRRRMVLETALHRWDAEHAAGREARVEEELAHDGVEEALRLYLEQRLDGRQVGGRGQRVAFAPAAAPGWTLTLHEDRVVVTDGIEEHDAVVRGSALDLWLLLTCRRPLEGLAVDGDHAAAELAVAAAAMVPGPAG